MNGEIKRGEVYLCDLDPVLGSEQRGRRPVLVLSNNIGNKHGSTVIVAAITSQPKPELPTHLPLSGVSGLHKASVVLLEQIRTVDKCRFQHRIASLGLVAMRMVDAGLALSIGLKQIPAEVMVVSLCRTCVQSFFDSGGYEIARVDANQTVKEPCTICNVRSGLEYEVRRM